MQYYTPLRMRRPFRPVAAGGGGVTFGGSDQNEDTNQTTVSLSIDATGSNRLGVVFFSWRNSAGQSLSSLTWGGTAMTDCGAGQVGGTFISCVMYYILDTDIGSGSKTITATISASSPQLDLHVFWFNNAHQTTPIGTASTHNNDSDATPTSINVGTTTSDGIVCGGFTVQANEAVTSSNTAIEEATSPNYSLSTGRAAGTGSAVDLTWTWTTTARARGIAFNVNAA